MSIATRVSEVIAAFERGEVSVLAVEESIELHEPALEAIPRETRDLLHNLSAKLVREDLSPVERELLGVQASQETLAKLKAVVAALLQAAT